MIALKLSAPTDAFHPMEHVHHLILAPADMDGMASIVTDVGHIQDVSMARVIYLDNVCVTLDGLDHYVMWKNSFVWSTDLVKMAEHVSMTTCIITHAIVL
uniref:Uncharacterized protein n=1 Tax=Arion vulgaris TaxID=1028688 RepID=A0A0B7BPE6_9EUPU